MAQKYQLNTLYWICIKLKKYFINTIYVLYKYVLLLYWGLIKLPQMNGQ